MTRMNYRMAGLLAACVLLVGATASAQDAPYVGAYEADNFFSTINSNEMAVLRTKKILFASRSSGMNITDGLTRLKNKNAMHNLMNSYVRYDVYDAGGDLSIIPTNVYSGYNFVHFLCSLYPLTKRLDEIETLLRAPYSFGNQVDVVMVHHAATTVDVFDPYTNSFDRLQAEFPNIKFIYITGGLGGSVNTNSAEFSRLVRARYQGNAPLYDVGYLVSDDGACGDQYCPGYSSDGLHANSEFIEERLGKAFLLILRDIYFGSACTSSVPPTVPANLSGTALSDNSIRLTWDPSTHGECGVARYDLTRNGSPLASLTRTNYTDTGLTENTAYQYAIRSVSVADIASVYSSTTTVSTLVDSTPPTVTWVKAVSGPQVTVQFSENMDPVSCAIATNYSINYGVTVLSAALSGKTVTLTTSGMANGTNYTLTLNNVADGSSATNPVAPGTQALFTYLSSAYPETPTAYWPMNGSLNDISGNALHGAWPTALSSYKTALLGQGMALNGATSSPTFGTYMKVNHNSLLDGMPQLSISVWARKNNAATGGELFKKHVVYNMEVSASGIAGYIYNSDTGKVNFSAANLTGLNNTNWHHFALVYNGTNVFTFVDGVRTSSNVLSGSVKSSSTVLLYVGREATTPPYNTFAGDIDEMKLFHRALSTNEVAALFANGIAGHADQLAVRAILDANNLTNRLVDAASAYVHDRTTELYLQEAGVTHLTADIGQLSELTLLHCYGDRALGHPLLTQVAPAIGSCTKLTELLLFQNSLTNLPSAITNLTKLTTFSIGDNLLCGSYPWENWADTYDPDWRATQDCPASLYYIYSTLHGPGSVFPTNSLAVGAGQSTQLVYSANAWHEITNFLGNGAAVPAAIGRPAYTAVYANVSANITNEVTFAVVKASADGQTPATWYGPLGANPAVADEDQDSLSLNQEYLINSNPAQSNAFKMISAGLGADLRVELSWQSLGLPNGQVQIGLRTDLNGVFTSPAGTTVYSNGICTWRSDSTLTNRTGFVRLRINSMP